MNSAVLGEAPESPTLQRTTTTEETPLQDTTSARVSHSGAVAGKVSSSWTTSPSISSELKLLDLVSTPKIGKTGLVGPGLVYLVPKSIR